MHKYAWIAVVGLLVAGVGCGDDKKGNGAGGGGGEGGGGGSGPVEPAPNDLTITTESGRSFVSPRAEIRINEAAGGELPKIEGHVSAAEEDTGLVYDIVFRLSKNQLLEGQANPNLSGGFPDKPGLGKIEVDTESTTLTSNGTTDTLNLELDRGHLQGEVESPKSDMKATIEGGYDLVCYALVDGTPVNDPKFESDFCAEFAVQRPVEE